MPQSVAHGSFSDAVLSRPAEDPRTTDEKRVVQTVIRRLIPFLCLLFVVNYLDRTNIAMAKLRMLGDTGISEQAYGLGAGMFFLAYFLFEVPSNLIMERVGARLWMTRIMVTWGLISAAMMFVRGPMSLYGLRFLLGAAEAGFFPGIVLYLTYWIPQRHRSGVLSWFLTATAVSGMIGNPMAGLLMKFDGVLGYHGWQWLFLIEGLLPVGLGVATLLLLPDRPARAKWLSPEDRATLERQLTAEPHATGHLTDLRHALTSGRLWQLGVNYFMMVMGLYGFIYWMPSILKAANPASSDLHTGLLSGIPCLVAAVTMVLIGRHADRSGERRWHVAWSGVVGAIGILLVMRCHTTATVLPALCLAAIGIWGALGPFWALCTRLLRGTAAAGGIAIVNSMGALSGFVAPYAIGWVKQHTGGFGGLMTLVVALLCSAVLVLCVPRSADRDTP